MTGYLAIQSLFWGAMLALATHLVRGSTDKAMVAAYWGVCALQFGLAVALLVGTAGK